MLSRGRQGAAGYKASGISFPCDTGRFWTETPIDKSAGHLAESEIARRLQGSLISRGLRSARGGESGIPVRWERWHTSCEHLGQQIASGIPYRHAIRPGFADCSGSRVASGRSRGPRCRFGMAFPDAHILHKRYRFPPTEKAHASWRPYSNSRSATMIGWRDVPSMGALEMPDSVRHGERGLGGGAYSLASLVDLAPDSTPPKPAGPGYGNPTRP